jgi:hypothetical protein
VRIGNCLRVDGAPPVIQQGYKIIVDHAAFEDAETRQLERRSDFRAREFAMVAVIRLRIRVHVEKIIEIIIHAAAERELDPVVDGRVIRCCQDQPAAGNENAMNFGEHALWRKRVMLYHVRLRREVERIVRGRQRLEPEIALAIIYAAIQDGFQNAFVYIP